jgi:hypothetical protein
MYVRLIDPGVAPIEPRGCYVIGVIPAKGMCLIGYNPHQYPAA